MNSFPLQLRSAAARYRHRLEPPAGRLLLRPADLAPRRPYAVCRLGQRPAGESPVAAAVAGRLARRSRLEAVLLLAREPLSLRKLAQSANLTDGTEARTLLTELRRCYDARGCAFQVEQLAGGYQLMTRPKFAPWLRPIVSADDTIRLSPPALETLAVVAYRQPALRAEVEAIRGVACGEILRQLMDRDLLRIVGRSEELGRPLWYGTTKRFLHTFGLCSLDQLPLAAQLRRTTSTTSTDNRASTSGSISKHVAQDVAERADAA